MFSRDIALPPQPGGFEGFLAIEGDPLARDQAVADAVDAGEVAYHLDPLWRPMPVPR